MVTTTRLLGWAFFLAACLLAAPAFGYLRIHPENPHYFQETTTGKPVLVMGHGSSVPEWGGYDDSTGISDYKAHRIPWVRVWHLGSWGGDLTIWPWAFSSQKGACYNSSRYKVDMNTWNPTYWSRMNSSLALCNQGGIYAEVMLFDRCWMSPADWDRWGGNPWARDNNINNLEVPSCIPPNEGVPEFYYWSTKPNLRYQQERYVRKMIDETIANPNVIYEVENEHIGSPSIGWADHYAQFVKDYIAANYPDMPRLVSFSTIGGDLDDCFDMPSLDVVNIHFGSEPESFPGILNTYLEPNWGKNKAMNVDEFANSVTSLGLLRRECWTIISSGGNFHIEDAEDSICYTVIENMRSFVATSGWDFIHAAPNKALITSGGGYCMAQPGVEYFCYFPTSGSKTLTLSAGTYRLGWWNPTLGGFYNVTSFSHAGGAKVFWTPDTGEWILHLTTNAAPTCVLQSKLAATAITVDGSSSDWNLSQFTTKIHAGDSDSGDIALLGYDTNGVCYSGGHSTSLQYPPTNPADLSARIYSRTDAGYLYFLVRVDDSDIRYPNALASNYLNDCVEFYIDPGHDHGSSVIYNSTSDAQLVIDANNQANVYATTSAYKTQVLNGVTSAVSRDASGWWLEVRLAKSAFSPVIPSGGAIGLDIDVRDNDNNGDVTRTSLITWRDQNTTDACPSKAPIRWGDLAIQGPPAAVTGFTATSGNQRNFLRWTNPTGTDFAGVKVLFKTTGYPSSASDGTPVYQGTGTSCTHDSLMNGTTYYYAAYAYDVVPNYSAAAQANAAPVYLPPAQAKMLANGAQVTLTAGVVSAVFSDCFYVQCVSAACGACGIRVTMAGFAVQVGQSATVKGTILTDPATGERYISATWVSN